MSLGPEIPGKDVHLTWFVKNGDFDSHLTIVENGSPNYRGIVHENATEFWSKIARELHVRRFNEPYDPDAEALLLTRKAMKYLSTKIESAVSVEITRRSVKLDLNFVPFIYEVIPRLASVEMWRIGKAKELFTFPPVFRTGFGKGMRILKITEDGVLVTYPADSATWMPILDEALGFNALAECLETKRLTDHLITSCRVPRRFVLS